MSAGIKVFAPATIGNLGVGFDILGMAIEGPGDEIIVSKSSKFQGLSNIHLSGCKSVISADPRKNTAGIAALAVMREIGVLNEGVEMWLNKRMPIGSGLGSSAASAVAGAFAINELFGRPFSKLELLPFAMEGEYFASNSYHADNVAPCLLGGMIMATGCSSEDLYRLPLLTGLHVAIVYPKVEILTKDAREILEPDINLDLFVKQSAHLAGFINGVFRNDYDLCRKHLKDLIIEPQRARLIPHFYELKNRALSEGAIGCSISGAGPSIFALCSNSVIAEKISHQFVEIYSKHNVQCSTYVSKINNEGVKLL